VNSFSSFSSSSSRLFFFLTLLVDFIARLSLGSTRRRRRSFCWSSGYQTAAGLFFWVTAGDAGAGARRGNIPHILSLLVGAAQLRQQRRDGV
jgi:hypothetical protein